MDTESLSHTKWRCKYHIVFAPKYGRVKTFAHFQFLPLGISFLNQQ
jgi:REP element-mobilizing transposase RayT